MASADEMKHTQGAWTLLPQNGAGPMVVHEFETGDQMKPTGYRLIAHMLQRGNSLEQDRANARLIASAPDMLAALLAEQKAEQAVEAADEYTHRAEAEDWLNDPTGSMHVRGAWDNVNALQNKARELRDAAIAKAVQS